MSKKDHQISVKIDDRLLSIIDTERQGTERSRAAQVRYMIEKYIEFMEIATPTRSKSDQSVG